MIIDYLQKKTFDIDKIQEILKPSIELNHWSNNGPVKTKLEEYLHKYLDLNDNKCVVAVSSATAGLHLLMMYYEYINNKELKWISPSYTFPSITVNNPKNVILKDIDLDTYTISDTNLDDFDGLILTNLFGTYPNNISYWIKFCNENNKILIFDNASSPLSKLNDVNICNFGDSCIISFHPTKYLGAQCEAGAIVIDKDKYDIINSMTNFGFNNSRIYNKYSSNFKLDDIRAAFLLNHLENYDIDKHLYYQNYLINQIKDLEGVKVFNFKDEGEILGNLCLEFDNPTDNKNFMDMGITAHKYYLPLNQEHQNSMELYKKMINMPLNAGLSEFQLDFLIKQIRIKCNE